MAALERGVVLRATSSLVLSFTRHFVEFFVVVLFMREVMVLSFIRYLRCHQYESTSFESGPRLDGGKGKVLRYSYEVVQ